MSPNISELRLISKRFNEIIPLLRFVKLGMGDLRI
jgi:hypothetical protein